MIYGYCRISTKSQNLERQIRNIKSEYPNAFIVKEVYTGTKLNRPEWNKLYNRLKPGDVIVFDSVSRMSRDAEEGFKIYQELYSKSISLIFLKEHHIDTSTYKKALNEAISLTGTAVDYILEGVNRYLMELAREQIKLAFTQSQKEVDDLHQRVKEGMVTAALNGKQIGRVNGRIYVTTKQKDSIQLIERLSKDFGGSNTDIELMKMTGLARNTYYKYKKIIHANNL